MKLIQLSKYHYIIVDDSEIKEGDWIGFPNLKKFVPVQYFGGDLTGGEKKITHSTQPLDCACSNKGYKLDTNCAERNRCFDKVQYLPLQEVKELIGVVDVENRANDILKGLVITKDERKYFEFGYNQAVEDNKEKKYTEEDIRKAISETRKGMLFIDKYVNEFIESLQPQTEWRVEFLDGKLKLK